MFAGPPSNQNDEIISPAINTTTQQCINGWICEHRWPEIKNMIKFRNVVRDAPMSSWWDNDASKIAFCRGTRGFIAFNNDDDEMNENLFTCLPSGVYCDIITGDINDEKCTGKKVAVDENGDADIQIAKQGVLAIHIGV